MNTNNQKYEVLITVIYISTIYKIYRYINIYIYIDMKSIKQISINKIIVLILVILLFKESSNQENLNINDNQCDSNFANTYFEFKFLNGNWKNQIKFTPFPFCSTNWAYNQAEIHIDNMCLLNYLHFWSSKDIILQIKLKKNSDQLNI